MAIILDYTILEELMAEKLIHGGQSEGSVT